MTFGTSLKQERELRGISLEEISRHTRVNPRFLEAIEQDDLSALPAKAFAKGFLRSYARMVGLDEQQVISNFEYCYQTMLPNGHRESYHPTSSRDSRHRVVFLTLFLIILALTALVILYYQGYLHY